MIGLSVQRKASAAAAVVIVLALAAAVASLQSANASQSATPVRGGTLKYGIDGDGTGFHPEFNVCAQACKTISRAIFDPLAALDKDSNVVPYLAKSIKANAKSTVWTIVARPGVKFHNGEAFNGRALQANLEAYRKSDVIGSGLAAIKAVDLNGPMSVKVKLSSPWVRFPDVLTAEAGWMVAPSMIGNKDSALKPIGTGPFRLKSWKQGDRLTVVRNKSYWRKGFPYLDQIDFIPIVDVAARVAALRQKQVDMIMLNDNNQIARLRKIKSIVNVETTYAAATDEFVLNNEVAPTNDLRIRKALAHATDQDALRKVLGAGVVRYANGPFPPGNIGYKPKTAMPTFNLAQARTLVAAYEAEKGPAKITLQVVPTDTTRGQLAQSMWQKAGIDVELITKDPVAQIFDLLKGTYQVAPGQLPGMPDPEGSGVFWTTKNLLPFGEISFNYARIRDAQIDNALVVLRENSDPKARRAAAQRINDRFATRVYAIWTYWVVWSLAHSPNVHDPAVISLPEGGRSAPYREGTNWVAQIYKTR